jgi:hypothetical protein
LLKLSTAGASQRVEDAFRRKRLMLYLGSERLQGIIDSNPHRSHRTKQTAFADALGPGPRLCFRRLDMLNQDVGHLTGHWDKVVGHCSIEQVSILAVDALFKKNRSDARAAERWRSVKVTEFERRQTATVRKELDEEYEAAVGLNVRPSKGGAQAKISSNSQT